MPDRLFIEGSITSYRDTKICAPIESLMSSRGLYNVSYFVSLTIVFNCFRKALKWKAFRVWHSASIQMDVAQKLDPMVVLHL